MEGKGLKKIIFAVGKNIETIVQGVLKGYNIEQCPPIKIQSVSNIPNIDYNTPTLLSIFNQHKDKKSKTAFGLSDVKQFCSQIIESFNPLDDTESWIEQLGVSEQGFLTIKLKESIVEEEINNILKNGLIYPLQKKEKVAIDFSSPNIAKQMHVGHLRTTIIGESICRILEFQGHEVLRINHIGDWGTQFGMLIAYLRYKYPNFLSEMPDLSDLNTFYKESKELFSSDAEFKKTSQLTVVSLQKGDKECLKAWETICEISRKEYQKIYKRLDITLNDCGESFYNDKIPDVIEDLKQAGMLVQDKGAQCVFIESKKGQPPLFIVKSDGGYGYDSTDMAAIKYRLKTLQCDRLIYITDLGQQPHFDYVIAAAQKIGWHLPPHTRCQHMGFGLVLDENGKRFRSSSGEPVLLKDLLDEAKIQALKKIMERVNNTSKNKQDELEEQNGDINNDEIKVHNNLFDKDKQEVLENETKGKKTLLGAEEEYLEAAEKMGMAAIKYYDLHQNRQSDYNFCYKKMLDTKGNTAVYLLYTYARLCSIIRKSGYSKQDICDLMKTTQGFKFTHTQERSLAVQLIKFADVIETVSNDLTINRLTDFIYDIACKFAQAYDQYSILNSEHKQSRVLLIETTRIVLEKGLFLIGITPLEKI